MTASQIGSILFKDEESFEIHIKSILNDSSDQNILPLLEINKVHTQDEIK